MAAIVSTPVVAPSIAVRDLGGVLFNINRDYLKKEYLGNIDEVFSILSSNADYRVVLEGHTDNTGNAAYNLDLSQRRSNRVAEYLKNKGISASRISTAFNGQDIPRDNNSTVEGRKMNRRVEFRIVDGSGNTLYRTSRF